MRETGKHLQAFEDYYAAGPKRKLEEIAKKYKVTWTTARKWSSAFDWAERIIQRDKRIATKVEEKTDNKIADEKAKLINITKLAITTFIENLKLKKVSVTSVADYERLVNTYLKLMGEAPDETLTIKIIDAEAEK